MHICAINQSLMSQAMTEKVMELCFTNPVQACALAQAIIDTCQVMSCATYASLKGKSKRAVLYSAQKLTGVEIEGRKFVSFNQ